MPFSIVEGDIAEMRVDAIVNAANERLEVGGSTRGYGDDGRGNRAPSVSQAVFSRAGARKMRKACRKIGTCRTGEAVLTPGFSLPARYVVHAVGPVWQGGGAGEEELLRSAYAKALETAYEAGCRSVALPLISAGAHGYPLREVLRVATSEILAFVSEREDVDAVLVVRDRQSLARTLDCYENIASRIDAICTEPVLAMRMPEESVPIDWDMPSDATYADMAYADEEQLAMPLMAGFAADAAYEAPGTAPDAALEASLDAAPEVSSDAVHEVTCAIPDETPGTALDEDDGTFSCLEEAEAEFTCTSAGRAAGPARIRTTEAEMAMSAPSAKPAQKAPIDKGELEQLMEGLDASFSATVFALIDERGLKDSDVYKRANISRQLFSKLRRDDGYRPTKQTAVALALALELDIEQTEMLLERAGYALSHNSKFDVIVEYFILHGNHDVFAVNEMLFAFDQPLLGSV